MTPVTAMPNRIDDHPQLKGRLTPERGVVIQRPGKLHIGQVMPHPSLRSKSGKGASQSALTRSGHAGHQAIKRARRRSGPNRSFPDHSVLLSAKRHTSGWTNSTGV
ncbi:hypothetical protein, partial [Methylobacterium sp. CCH7-A2]|uniref:hypothetical protein n=1 Tax=Methylobacterium sp. CCH7-A2 TaxID=1768789 RepID=UPI001AEC8532